MTDRRLTLVTRCLAAALGTVAVSVWAAPSSPALSFAPGGVVPAKVAPPQALGCLIEPSAVADVGSPAVGVLQTVHVERGDLVKKGQVLAELRADIERAQVDVAQSRARAEAELAGARQALDFARRKQVRTEDLVHKEFVSRQALDQAQAETQVAEARWRAAQEQHRHAGRELQLAHAQLDTRTLRAPLAGVVVERWRNSGERVEDRPVLRIAAIDPLRVEVVLPAALYGQVQPGSTAQVQPELAQMPALQGTVQRVDRVIDAASNTFRARLSLPNPDGKVPAGLRCAVQFAQTADATPSPSAPVPAASHAAPGKLPLTPSMPVEAKPAAAVQPDRQHDARSDIQADVRATAAATLRYPKSLPPAPVWVAQRYPSQVPLVLSTAPATTPAAAPAALRVATALAPQRQPRPDAVAPRAAVVATDADTPRLILATTLTLPRLGSTRPAVASR